MSKPVPSDALAAARLLRWGVAFVWLWTGLAVFHPYYRFLGESYLAPLGLPPEVMYATCAAEVLLGLRVALGRAATWLTVLQVVMIAGFTAILSVSQPGLWLHPLGMLTKNLALVAMLGAAWSLERDGWSDRTSGLLCGGMAVFCLVDGLLNSFAPLDPGVTGMPLTLIRWLGRCEAAVTVVMVTDYHVFPMFSGAGVAPATEQEYLDNGRRPSVCCAVWGRSKSGEPVAVIWIPWNRCLGLSLVLLLGLQVCALSCVTTMASLADGLLWFHPFGPLTKNVAIVVALGVLIYYWKEIVRRRRRTPSDGGSDGGQ